MSDRLLFIVTFGSTLGCGLAAGVFFGFSTFVMKALGRLAPAQGIAAMQSINVAAITAPFMVRCSEPPLRASSWPSCR